MTKIPSFSAENMIDEEAFMLLNESVLKEMNLPVGQRIKLQKKLQELQVFFLAIYLYEMYLSLTKLFDKFRIKESISSTI